MSSTVIIRIFIGIIITYNVHTVVDLLEVVVVSFLVLAFFLVVLRESSPTTTSGDPHVGVTEYAGYLGHYHNPCANLGKVVTRFFVLLLNRLLLPQE